MHVDVRRWAEDISTGVDEGESFQSVMKGLRGLFNGLNFTVTTRYPLGTNIFERDWDLLIVLDACRVDALREVAPEYDFIQDVGSIWSVGSSSHEWICKTFTNEYVSDIKETVAITTNPFFPQVFDERTFPPKAYAIPLMCASWDLVEKSDFKDLLQIHRHDYEEFFKSPPPDIVTDHAIHAARTLDFSQMVVHYFQPHTPYISTAYKQKRSLTEIERDPWTALREGTKTREEIWGMYLDNLRLVLDSIERLVRNIDTPRVVITADHGDLFGELGAYGHPEGFFHPDLKKVPWGIASAKDHGESHPDVDVSRQRGDKNVEERLKELGYL